MRIMIIWQHSTVRENVDSNLRSMITVSDNDAANTLPDIWEAETLLLE